MTPQSSPDSRARLGADVGAMQPPGEVIRAALDAESPAWREGKTWFVRAAERAMQNGACRLISGRNSGAVYLARFWLHEPRRLPRDVLDSGASLLLHWIARDDDDGALHDHPWSFRSTILSGGYVEDLLGDNIAIRSAGDSFRRGATDLHRVARVQPDTWTLVLTEPKERTWGFVPAGGRWTDWRTFLGLGAGVAEESA